MTTVSGLSGSQFDNLQVEHLYCDKLDADTFTIADYEVQNVTASTVDTNTATVTTLNSTNADITNAFVENLNVGSGTLYATGSSDKVGINTTTPSAALDVVGDVRISGTLNVNNNAIYVSPTNGFVGINSDNPSARLYVNGSCTANGIMYSYGLSTTGNCTVTGTVSAASGFNSTFSYVGKKVTLQTDALVPYFSADQVNGRIGLGDNNSSPTEVLDVKGNIKYSGELKLPTTTFVTPSAGSLGYTIKYIRTVDVDFTTSPTTNYNFITATVATGVWLITPKLDIRALSTPVVSFYNIKYTLDGVDVYQQSSYQSFSPPVASSVQESLPLTGFTVTNTSTTSKTLLMSVSFTFTGGTIRINTTNNQVYLKLTRIA